MTSPNFPKVYRDDHANKCPILIDWPDDSWTAYENERAAVAAIQGAKHCFAVVHSSDIGLEEFESAGLLFHNSDARGAYEKLDRLACALMDTRPDLKQYSLDEWAIEHAEKLTAAERNVAQEIIDLYAEL